MPSGSSPNSRKNLRKAWDSKTAAEMGRKSVEARRAKKYDKAIMREDINSTLGVEIDVPPELYAAMKKLGVECHKRERLSKLIMFKAMLKAMKDGNMRSFLDLAEFAGFKDAMKVELSGKLEQRSIVVNFRRATPEDAK